MKVLVVGGSGFLGTAISRASLHAGHDVSILSRAKAPAPEGVTIIAADRAGPLPDLRGHGFDAVFDTSAYRPSMVAALRTALGDRIARYVMVSSISVYESLPEPGLGEDSPARAATPEECEEAEMVDDAVSAASYAATYGPLKRSCEEVAVDWLGARATLLRVGLLIGPGDYTDRMTFWVRRIAQGGVVPIPGPQDRPVQVVDVADVAAFALRCVDASIGGVFNVTGPTLTFEQLVTAIRDATGSDTTFRWMPPERFAEAGLSYWTDLPLILPPDEDLRGMLDVSTAAARAQGLTIRPLGETLAAIHGWDKATQKRLAAGFPAEAEAALLQG
jgi:2'-hydroxyisoflavone reductase